MLASTVLVVRLSHEKEVKKLQDRNASCVTNYEIGKRVVIQVFGFCR